MRMGKNFKDPIPGSNTRKGGSGSHTGNVYPRGSRDGVGGILCPSLCSQSWECVLSLSPMDTSTGMGLWEVGAPSLLPAIPAPQGSPCSMGIPAPWFSSLEVPAPREFLLRWDSCSTLLCSRRDGSPRPSHPIESHDPGGTFRLLFPLFFVGFLPGAIPNPPLPSQE